MLAADVLVGSTRAVTLHAFAVLSCGILLLPVMPPEGKEWFAQHEGPLGRWYWKFCHRAFQDCTEEISRACNVSQTTFGVQNV